MVSSTHRSRSAEAAGWWWPLLALLFWCASVMAEEQEPFIVAQLSTEVHDEVYLLDVELKITLGDEPLAALKSGVPLTFLYEFDVERVRNWLPDDSIASLSQRKRVTFHALSHRYLVTNLNSGATSSYPTLDSALTQVGTIDAFPLLDAKFIKEGERYLLDFRAQLDIESLPAPLRPLAYLTPAWRDLKSDWNTWPLKP